MTVIYEPKGAAREYSELACNLYKGCMHGCKYCYVPGIPPWKYNDTGREFFHSQSIPRNDIVRQFEIDCMKRKGTEKEILFCFTCDPFQVGRDNTPTLECLKIAERYKIKNIQVLTKGGMSASPAFEIIARNGWKFAQTVVFADDKKRMEYEPNSSDTYDRLCAAKTAKEVGCKTWVSMEPVIECEEAKAVYEMFLPYCDFWKIGKINHNKELENSQYWKAFVKWITSTIPKDKYYLKHSLRPYA